jgi:hypothetical protein
MWWLDKVGYEVYLRSFADGDGDGVGDLRGLGERLEYLAWLGVGIVWVTPFHPSPMRDHGYDVADYTGVDPLFGSLDDFDQVLAGAHDLLANPEPPLHERLSGVGRAASSQLLKRINDIDQPGVHEVYPRWRKLVEPYGAMLLGECTCATLSGSPATCTMRVCTCRSGSSRCRSPGSRRRSAGFWPTPWPRPPGGSPEPLAWVDRDGGVLA